MAGKTIAEQIAALKATRDSLADKMGTIGQKAMDEDRSMNTAEQSEFDDAKATISTLDGDIKRYTELETIQGQRATPAAEQAKSHSEAPARSGTEFATIKTVEKLDPGIAFARYAMCLTASKGNHEMAFRLAERHYPQTESVVKTLKAQAEGANLQSMMQIKATVPAGTTTGETWAAPLVYASNWGGDFVNFLRARSLIGQAQFRPVPFNVRIAGASTGGTGYWVGQGKAKPVTSFGFNALTSAFTKVAAITVITEELARFSDPSAEVLVRDMLGDAVVEAIDTKLFSADPVAAGVSPAGLLNGVTPVAGPATADPDDIRCALLTLWAGWDTANLGNRPAYYTTPAVARFLAFTRDALGNPAFPGMTANGGALDGIPVRVSQYLAAINTTGGSPLILVDESEIYLADDGSVTLDASREATIEMSDTPAGSSSPTVAASSVLPVSMWQTNSIALRAERFIWWGKRRNGAVAYIADFPASC